MNNIKNFIKTLSVVLLCAVAYSCGSDDDEQTLSFSNMNLVAGNSAEISNGKNFSWTSSNEYIATVSGSTVTAKRVGTAKISSNSGSFNVTVTGQYDLYDEPCIDFGASKSQVKSKMSGYTLKNETDEILVYERKKKEAYIGYSFKDSRLNYSYVFVPTSYGTTLVKFLSERHIAAAADDDYVGWISIDKKTAIMIPASTVKMGSTYCYSVVYADFTSSSSSSTKRMSSQMKSQIEKIEALH